MMKPLASRTRAFILTLLLLLGSSPREAQAQVRIEEGRLLLSSPVRFETGSDVLAADSEDGLNQVIEFLGQKTYITLLRVETNAAALADRDANATLGALRAQRLATWFKAHGMDCKRLIFVTFGQDKPAVAGKGEENERVEFRPATLRNIPIGGAPIDGFGLVVEPPCP